MFKYVFCFGLLSLLTPACQPEKKVEAIIFQEVDQLITGEHNVDRFHGSIIIGNQDSILYQKHLGIANRVWEIPINSKTRFDIASINKSFIAGLILIAVEEGKMRLGDRLVDVLKGYNYTGYFNPNITIHHLLSHTSGLPDYNAVTQILSANGFLKFKRINFSNEEYVDYISHLKPMTQPNEEFYYSNFAYHLLCIILEDTYLQTFPSILQEKICSPLGLHDTYSSIENRDIFKNLAEGYNYRKDDQKWISNNFIDLTLGRRIFSTTSDLQKWARAMNDNRLLSNNSLTLMKMNQLEKISNEYAYGYGWVVFGANDDYEMGNLEIDYPFIIHGGSTEGYKTMLVNIDNGRYIISILSNVGSRMNEMELTKKIVELLIPGGNDN